MEPLRLGILGAARITDLAIIKPSKVTGTRLVAVAARDPARATAFAEAHGIGRVHESYLDDLYSRQSRLLLLCLTDDESPSFLKWHIACKKRNHEEHSHPERRIPAAVYWILELGILRSQLAWKTDEDQRHQLARLLGERRIRGPAPEVNLLPQVGMIAVDRLGDADRAADIVRGGGDHCAPDENGKPDHGRGRRVMTGPV